MRAVLIGAPGKAYDVSIRYRYRGKHSARQTLTATAPADLEATNAASIDGQGWGATASENTIRSRVDNLNAFNRNPTFQAWASTLPDNWVASGTPTIVKNTTDEIFGDYVLDMTVAASAAQWLQCTVSSELRMPPDLAYYAIEYDVTLVSGDFQRAGILWRVYYQDASNYKDWRVKFNIDHAAPTAGRRYTGVKVFASTDTAGSPSGVPTYNRHLYVMGNWNGLDGAAYSAKQIRWNRVLVRPASAQEISALLGLDANGDLARNIASARADSSNILRRATGGLFTGDLAATDGAAWATNLTGRPTELTDGRVSATLSSTGRVNGAWRASNPLITGASAYRTPINPLSSSDAGATATISIAAHTVKTSDTGAAQKTASYNSGSITGRAFGTSYHVFAYDPTFAGGAVTYVSSTSSETYVTNAEYVYVGYITTVNDGGGGGGGYSPPPEDCVSAQAWLTPDLMALDADVGDMIDCLDGESFASFAIDGAATARAPCVRLISESGVALTCSRSTPITQPDGDVVLAPAALGAMAAVDDAAGFRWERIADVIDAGEHLVRRIHIGGRTYAAGDTPGRRMFTHNPIKP